MSKFDTYTSTLTQSLIEWTRKQPNADCRRWSYEIESPEIARHADSLFRVGFECHHDGSVSDVDCDCECDDCQPHSCDCDHCDRADYYDPDHCATCMATEAAPSNHKPVTTTHDTERLDYVRENLDEDYIDSTCGNHIHINATDLTPRQIANVMRLWDKVQNLLSPVIGRSYTGYADNITEEDIAEVAQGNTVDRYKAVNTQGILYHLSNGRHQKSTIEFRQFAGTVDADLIIARGFICRALVEYCQKDQPLYWLNRTTTAKELLAELGIKL